MNPRTAYIACRHLLYCARKGPCCVQAHTVLRVYISESSCMIQELADVAEALCKKCDHLASNETNEVN